MANETFFTVIGCMDGRCVDPVEAFGRQEFGAKYADYITEPGIVKLLTENPSEEFLTTLKNKILISVERHGSQGIVVDGHQECAGAPIPDIEQKERIKKSVKVIQDLIQNKVPVVGVFVERSEENPVDWESKEIPMPFA